MKIGKDAAVFFRYNLAPQGQEVEFPGDEEPLLSYLHGQGQLVPGLEAALEGHEAGDRFAVSLSPDQAWGERDESLIEHIEREAFAGIKDLRPGKVIQVSGEDNKPTLARVVSLDNRTVVIDTNHPYAGVSLEFRVEVTAVRDATPEELVSKTVSDAAQ
ncbi:MAG: peptidylprolyl isomerase [Oceanospirillaceae bacterium]|jgi:FKBP-type peptidyl-prolyl cis-trans isomerase SlyD|nr:peptidylprolyl isomerase [Oceanospirillaceae bacterium]